MAEPRIPPLPTAERQEVHQVLLDSVGGAVTAEMNIFTTLVRHPRLFRRWLPLGGVLLTGKLPGRDRELLILRTAHHCGADYEWAHHVEIGKQNGLTDDEIERVRLGPTADGWSSDDAVLLRAADELHADSRIGDATWGVLAQRYDEQQLIELPILVGQYHLVAFALNSLGVEVEPGF
jgi:alkylhydroperoxidase family enzyme